MILQCFEPDLDVIKVDISNIAIWAELRQTFEPRLVADPTNRVARTIYGKYALERNRPDLAHFLFRDLDPWIGVISYIDERSYAYDANKARNGYLEMAMTGKPPPIDHKMR